MESEDFLKHIPVSDDRLLHLKFVTGLLVAVRSSIDVFKNAFTELEGGYYNTRKKKKVPHPLFPK